jgi:hypothetical protein
MGHGKMLMLIMGLYFQYINKTTFNFTFFLTFLQHNKDNAFSALGNVQRLIQLLIINT